MLPPGHFAAGYLLTQGLIQVVHPSITTTQELYLLFWGGFFGFAPDLDMFWAFFKNKGFTFHDHKKVYHRDYLPHAPLVWLLFSLIVYVISTDIFWQLLAATILLGSWSHFVLDSFKVGIRWLWPFSKHYYAFYMSGEKKFHDTKGFINYWLEFLKRYMTRSDFRTTFVLEVLIIITALMVSIIKFTYITN